MAAPVQSNCDEARSSRLSGTCVQVAHAPTATSGMLRKKAARQEIVSTRSPPISGPRIVVAPEAPAHVPKARPCSRPEKLAVIRATAPGGGGRADRPRGPPEMPRAEEGCHQPGGGCRVEGDEVAA